MEQPRLGEELKPDSTTSLEMDQLFPVTNPEDGGDSITSYVLANNMAWGRLTNDGGSTYDKVVGGDMPEVRKNRALLVGALCTYGHFRRFSAIDSRLAEMLKQVDQSREDLEEVGDKNLSEAFDFLQMGLSAMQRANRFDRIPDLNHCITKDPSDIMVGLTATENRDTLGQDNLTGLAKLAGIYYAPKIDGSDEHLPFKSLLRPVLIAQDGVSGTLPEGQAVRSLFVRTKPSALDY